MKIKEHLSVYLESGYLFDDMSGKLKWFEIDKILISFTYGVVRYVGTWGGCRAEKTLDGKLFYSSEECFKKDKSIPKTKLSIYDVFKSLYGFVLIGDVWKYKNDMFGRENMISEGSTISENDTICINIKYHKIGEVFNYKVGMSEMTLRVDKCDRCSGCAFENYIYDCVKSGCLGCEREDGESVRYTIVNT